MRSQPNPASTDGGTVPPSRTDGTTVPPRTTTHREKVERGIYRRTTRDGLRHEVMYRDRQGAQRLCSTHSDGSPLLTLREARERREELRADARRKVATVRTRVRFAEYAEQYLADTGPRKRTSTAEREAGDVRRHLIPRVGRVYLADLDADAVARLVTELSTSGKAIRKGAQVTGHTGLSAHSVRNVLGVLGRIMARAVRAGLVPTNPVSVLDASERPTADALPFPTLDASDLARFMQAVGSGQERATKARDVALVWLTLTTGLRQSEALGLRWRDVDLAAGELHVRQAHGRYGESELKTRAARRTVVVEPEAVRMLATLSLATRCSEPDDLVFVTASGKALGHRNVLRTVERARAKSGLDAKCAEQEARRLTFHGLRHAYASLRIANGDELADVSRAIGHSDVSLTARVYVHAIRERERVERDRERVSAAFAGVLS